jgi:phospho-N-acetylmuramoyl-pentapeptide-transferase
VRALITRSSGWFIRRHRRSLIGFADDYAKVSKQSSASFLPTALILGFANRGVAAYWPHNTTRLSCKTNWPANLQGHADQSRRAVHPVFMIVIVGAANAVNMTDG